MKISTRGRYALRFMIDLAQHDNGSYVALKDVSARQDISIKYLEQITSLLSKFGPAEYSVAEILRITEGSLAPVSCLETPENLCPRKETCQTLKLWEGLDKAINDYLSHVTLQDLTDENTAAECFSYVI